MGSIVAATCGGRKRPDDVSLDGINVDRHQRMYAIVLRPVDRRRDAMTDADIATLADTFSYAQARATGLTKHRLYQLRDSGSIEQIEWGLYRRADADIGDLDLVAAAARIPTPTMCLGTALAHHGLSDVIPSLTDIAIPRGHRRPPAPSTIHWHFFDPDTFEIGRETIRARRPTSHRPVFTGAMHHRCVPDARPRRTRTSL